MSEHEGSDKGMLESIKTDLERTYPDNVNFENRGEKLQQLNNVLSAVGKHIPSVGYCQVCITLYYTFFLLCYFHPLLLCTHTLKIVKNCGVFCHLENVEITL